jgi:FdhD protein
MEDFDKVTLDAAARIKTSWLYELTKRINTAPSLYLKAGAIHGCVLCQENRPLIYLEDVGRHNAVDKIAGHMFLNKIRRRRQDFLHHRAPHLRDGDQDGQDAHSHSRLALGFYRLGRRAGATGRLTLIGRARGKRFVALAGAERIVFDADLTKIAEEDRRHARKGSVAEAVD